MLQLAQVILLIRVLLFFLVGSCIFYKFKYYILNNYILLNMHILCSNASISRLFWIRLIFHARSSCEVYWWHHRFQVVLFFVSLQCIYLYYYCIVTWKLSVNFLSMLSLLKLLCKLNLIKLSN